MVTLLRGMRFITSGYISEPLPKGHRLSTRGTGWLTGAAYRDTVTVIVPLKHVTVTVTCQCHMSVSHVSVTVTCHMSAVTCQCHMSLLHVSVTCHCYMSVSHVSVTVAAR